jgi:hypothetical protein
MTHTTWGEVMVFCISSAHNRKQEAKHNRAEQGKGGLPSMSFKFFKLEFTLCCIFKAKLSTALLQLSFHV